MTMNDTTVYWDEELLQAENRYISIRNAFLREIETRCQPQRRIGYYKKKVGEDLKRFGDTLRKAEAFHTEGLELEEHEEHQRLAREGKLHSIRNALSKFRRFLLVTLI